MKMTNSVLTVAVATALLASPLQANALTFTLTNESFSSQIGALNIDFGVSPVNEHTIVVATSGSGRTLTCNIYQCATR